MSEKKELNQEQLEKVSGGEKTVGDDMNWRFTKDAQVFVELTDGTKVEGKVTKRGWFAFGMNDSASALDYYYVEGLTNTYVNKWYMGAKFVGNTVDINEGTLIEPLVHPW